MKVIDSFLSTNMFFYNTFVLFCLWADETQGSNVTVHLLDALVLYVAWEVCTASGMAGVCPCDLGLALGRPIFKF